MKQKQRKLLSRIGAGFLLGMSLFNFGAIWNKQRGGQIPQRARNIRRKKVEQVDPEVQQIASIAETEAEAVLATQQTSQKENQQQLQEEQTPVFQKFARYAAISVWAISATLLFSSAIFNYPLALGKGMLSLLPGVPHVAHLSLQTEREFFEVGKQMDVAALLETNGEKVDFVKIAIEYDPALISFESYEINQDLFDSLEERALDEQNGSVVLSFRNSGNAQEISKQEVVKYHFTPRERTLDGKVSIAKESSAVVKADLKRADILGKVSAVKFKVTEK